MAEAGDTRGRHAALLATLALALGGVVALGGWAGAAVAVSLMFVALLLSFGGPGLLAMTYISTRPLADVFVRIQFLGLSVGQLWSAGLLVVLVVWVASLGGRLSRREWLPLISFVVVYVLLAMTRGDVADGAQRGLRLLSWMLIVPATSAAIVRGMNWRWAASAGYAFALLATLVSAYSALTGRYGEAYYLAGSRLTMTYQSPHALVTMLVLGAPFVLLALIRDTSRWKWAHALLVVAMATLTLVSLVRSGILAMVVLLAATALVVAWRGSRQQKGWLVAVSVGFVGAWVSLQDMFIDRLAALLPAQAAAEGSVGSGRSWFWAAIADRVFQSPADSLVGLGGGADTLIIHRATGLLIGAHSDFFELLAVGGLVLVVAYASVVFVPVGRALTGLRTAQSTSDTRALRVMLVAATAAFGVLGLTNGVAGYQGSIAYGLLVGMVLGISQGTRQGGRLL